jgi:hypothetical protein
MNYSVHYWVLIQIRDRILYMEVEIWWLENRILLSEQGIFWGQDYYEHNLKLYKH